MLRTLSLLLGIGLLGCNYSFADITGGGAADLLNQTKEPEAIQKSAGGRKISMICTDIHGKQYKQGETGYLPCMEEFQAKKSASGNSTDSKPSAGFSFQLD